jgi:hypothetical protein
MITRRQALALAGAAPAWLASSSSAAPAPGNPRMGGTPTAFGMHSAAARRSGQPFDLADYLHSLGLGGVEVANVPATDPEAVKQYRAKIESYNMYLVCNPRLPNDANGVAAFDAQVKASKDLGAVAVHAAMTQRRYEEFSAFEARDREP